jgi:hypothetical protein
MLNKKKIIDEMLKAIASKRENILNANIVRIKCIQMSFNNNTCRVCAEEHLRIFIVH